MVRRVHICIVMDTGFSKSSAEDRHVDKRLCRCTSVLSVCPLRYLQHLYRTEDLNKDEKLTVSRESKICVYDGLTLQFVRSDEIKHICICHLGC